MSLDEPNLFDILSLIKDDSAVMDSLAAAGVPSILIPGFLAAKYGFPLL